MKNLTILMIMLIPFGHLFAQDPEGWFPYQSTNTAEAGIIGMADWLDAPAGKHGYLKMEVDDFSFEDGTKNKFWGTNHGNRSCGPEKAEAEKRVAWYAKMGIN